MNKNLKKVISTVAAFAMTASCFTAFAADFSDVADTAEYKVAVDNLVALGIVNGYEDGTFGPEKEITRAEISKMIVSAMGPAFTAAAEASKGSKTFDDVATDHWASGFIAQGVSNGYINGMGDGTFAPEANVTYAQTVKMLVSVLGYDEDAKAAGGYPNGYINIGSQIGVTDGVTLSGDTAVNRGQVAMLIDNALKTPINAIVGWEPGISMDENGNLVTVNIPKTEVYDGKGDSGKYETLLTTYFDAYAVRGRITDTAAKGKGEVEYQIEFAENFDGDVNYYTGKSSVVLGVTVPAPTTTITASFPNGTDVDALLCSYTDAIVREDEDGDWEIVSIVSYGKNDVVTLESALIDGYTDGSEINFLKNATSSKTNDYDLNAATKIYVNGELIDNTQAAIVDTNDIDNDGNTTETMSQNEYAITKYVVNNSTTTVKLINTPAAGSKSIDSVYDYIMLSVFSSAIIDEVEITESTAIVYLEDYNSDILGSSSEIKIDLDAVAEEEAIYAIYDVEGNEVALENLKADDVITIYTDVEGAQLNKPDFIEMTVCNEVVEGKVTSANKNDKGKWIYAIGDGEYAYAVGDTGTNANLKTGDEYTLYIDMFGKIIKNSALATSVNYGLINRVKYMDNADENQVRLINAKGEIVSYVFRKDADYTYWKSLYDANSAKALDATVTAVTVDDPTTTTVNEAETGTVYENFVVTYKVDSKDEIYDIAPIEWISDSTYTEYSERNAKVGSAKMSDATAIIDFTAVGVTAGAWSGNVTGDVSGATLASFVDGEDYRVLFGYTNNKFSDGTYPLAIVVQGVPGIAANTSFAVVDTTGSTENPADGIIYDSMTVYEGKDKKTLYFDTTVPSVNRGDVVVYSLDNDGLVDDFKVLFTVSGADGYPLATAAAFSYDPVDTAVENGATVNKSKYATYTKSNVTSWDNTSMIEKTARVGFGVLVEKHDGSATIGKVGGTTAATYATSVYNDIDFATDMNVYVYDFNNRESDRISVGSVGSLNPTNLASRYIVDNAGTDEYQWGAAGKTTVKTVFYKTYEDEITDIMVIIPKN